MISSKERRMSAQTQKAKALLAGIRLEPLSDYGDLMSVTRFIKMCEAGMFMNSDGSGYYSFKDEESDMPAYPSEVKQGDVNKMFTHVMWYNK